MALVIHKGHVETTVKLIHFLTELPFTCMAGVELLVAWKVCYLHIHLVYLPSKVWGHVVHSQVLHAIILCSVPEPLVISGERLA